MAFTEVQASNIAVDNEVPPLELISMYASLLNHRMLLVQRELPGLVSGASNPINQVALSMGESTREAWDSIRISQDNQTAYKQPKVLAKIWKSMFPTLIKLCEIVDQSLIPLPQSPRYPSVNN